MNKQKQPSTDNEKAYLSSLESNDKPEKNWTLISLIVGLALLIAGIFALFLFNKDRFSNGIPWILIAVAVLIVVIGIIAVVIAAKKKEKHEPDYYTFFILGICWLPLGVALDNYAFTVMGAVFMIIGLANKNKWKKGIWSDLSPGEKKFKTTLMIILGILVLLGLAAYFFVENK